MKQFTFSAQVANNLLKVLQGYTKGIRFIALLTILCTIGVGQMCGQATLPVDYSFSNGKSSLPTGVTSSGLGSDYAESHAPYRLKFDGNNDYIQIQTNAAAQQIIFAVKMIGGGSTSYFQLQGSSDGTSFTNIENFTISGSQNAVVNCTTSVAINSSYRYFKFVFTKGSNVGFGTLKISKAAASSFTITAQSNNNSYGTVSVSGTTITATPKTGYRVSTSSPFSISPAGSATVTQNGNTFAVTPTANCTITIYFEAIPKYTVTLVPGSGTCAASVTEASAGAGVTLPTPTLDGCGDWEFAGWKTTSAVTTETTTEPTLIAAGAYSPTSDITLYAVYQRTEGGGGGGGSTEVTFNFGYTDWGKAASFSGTTYDIVEQNDNGVSVTYTRNDGSLYANTTSLRLYKTNTLTFDAGSNTITSITFTGNIGQSDITTNAETCTNTTNALSWAGSSKSVTFTRPSNASSYATLTSATLTIGGGSTTYYHSTPDCGSTPDPIGYTITYNTNGGDAIAATSGTALPNPLPTPTREHYTFLGWFTDEDCTQAATAGATIDADITLYAKWEATMYTVTLNPNYPAGKTGVFKDKEGNTIAGNIEVLLQSGTASQALTNFYSSIELDNYAFDSFYTQAEGGSKRVNTGDITGNITFYAHWKEQHTITWNVNGDTELISPTTFAEGDAWDMPTTDYDCSGKEFVGWTTAPVASQDVAPDPLYTNASQFPNATATYYAVFAENTGGGGSGGYEKLTAALDDYSGEYLIVYEEGPVAFNGGLTTLDDTNNNISVTITEGVIASNTTTDAAKFTFAKVDGGYSILSASGKYIGREATSSNGLNTSSTYAAGYLNTITYNSITGKGGCALKYNSANDQKRFRYFTSGQQAIALYKKSGSSATYTGYTTSCVPTYSITYDLNGGSYGCSSTIVEEGGSHTICNETPEKTGHTFTGWKYNDTETIYQAGHEFTNITTDITLTAVWQPNTYTVTWSDKGAITTIEYDHGETLEVPLTDPTPCDGEKEFVGWTADNTFTYHATTPPTDLFKTTTATVTADTTYYAVFATKGAGGTEFVLGESGTFKMYANVDGTNHYAQGGVSSSQITSTTNALSASDYTLTHKGSNQYTIQFGNAYIGHSGSTSTNLNTIETLWKITAGENGSWRITSPVNESRALAYRASTYNIFKAYSMTNVEAGDTEYFDIEFGTGSSGYSDYTTTCQQVESIEVQSPQTVFDLTDDFTIGSGKVIATLSGGGTTDVTDLAHFSGYNMEVVGTYIVTVTYRGATATYEIIVQPLDNKWVLTWNVSGKTNTGLGPRTVTKGSAIGPLPTPEVPAACAGKTFMGWTTSNIVNSDGTGITYITPETKPSDNTTYYAVFATVNNFCTQKPINQIASGSKVVIVAVASLTDDGGAGKAISSRATDDTYNLQGDDVAIYDQTINTPHSTCIWTITKSGGKYIFTQDDNYLNAISDNGHYNLRYSNTQDTWTITNVVGMVNTYRMQSTVTNYFAEFFKGKFTLYKEANDKGDFDMQFYVTANTDGNADITDYTTGCEEYTITYYGFHGGYSTSCSSDGTIVLPVNSLHTVPDCGDVVKDHTNLGREFLNVWMTQPHGGHTFKPGDTFILTQDTTLYAQWKLNTQNDFTTLPTDVEDLAGTDVYVYGGKTLTLQPGTTTINSLTLKGGIQADSTYKMPTVWVPEGATLVRNSNKIYLDLVVNAETWYPFAVPFATKNDQYIDYLDPVLNAASKYDQHFVIKTYDGARRATQGEDRANNWVKVLRHQSAEKPSYLQPGVGYIITALTRPDKDTATIRIPMTVPNTWFQNGEQAVVGTTVRNTIAVTAHAGAAATEHQRHAGWNFVANPYLTSFAGGNVDNAGGLAYINGELIIEGSYEYGGEDVPYVTVPAYDFAYYSQHKLSDVKLSPEWSFFVQVGTGGTMNFTTAGRQQAPASIAARNAEERPVKMDVDLILSDNHSSDQTGLIISDRYTDAYEIGRDLEKLFGSAYNLSVYTLMEDNTPLAFQALAIRSSMQVIPVGYRAPEQGEYTFRLNEATSSIDLLNEQYEQLVLVDYQTGELTNLLYTDYTFYSERTQSNSRFAIYAVPRQNAPTDLPNAIGSDEEVRKVIYNDHLYILRDGNVYNGMGQKM